MAEEDQAGRRRLLVLQSMIDIFADRLIKLRTTCNTSHELTQSEIRILEGKLIKLFSGQLVTRSTIREQIGSIPANLKDIPSLNQWLEVVGLCPNCIQYTCREVESFDALLEKPQCKLKSFLSNCSKLEEEFRRISTALRNLKRCMDILINESAGPEISHLHWDSWDWQSNLRALPESNLPVPYASVSQDCPKINYNGIAPTNLDQGNNASPGGSSANSLLSPPLTPVHKNIQGDCVQKSPGSVSDNCRYNSHGKFTDETTISTNQTISKSRSHESQLPNLSHKGTGNSNFIFAKENNGETCRTSRRTRLPTVPCVEYSPELYSSPTRSPPFMNLAPSSTNNSLLAVNDSPIRSPESNSAVDSPSNGCSMLTVPRSPRTPPSTSLVMAHDIAHRFTKHFSFNNPCDYCSKPIIMNTGLKCKECRYRCHKDCESKVPPCIESTGFVEDYKRQLTPDSSSHIVSLNGAENSPLSNRHAVGPANAPPAINGFMSNIERRVKQVVSLSSSILGGSDTGSSNSHNSAPPSPASFVATQPLPATASAILNKKQQFVFSIDVINQEIEPNSSVVNDAISTSTTPSEPIYDKGVDREDSQDSQNWDNESVDKVWPRQYSVSMKEWEIPWNELEVNEKDPLGAGHFGTVFRGYWHGDVAIKVLNVDSEDENKKIIEKFKSEVSTFRKTRHDNLVLFMGACMEPKRLAIVTSLVHGITLYKYIHVRRDKFSMSKISIIAQQISQGMGYLHAKGIVHKDLRTKNIFLDKERVIITDFGLFSVTKLFFEDRSQDVLIIPPGWLCYLAPEIMRHLTVRVSDDEHLPFSKASDVYAFGTVWYELLCGEWPYTTQEPEAVIWQVGKGMKPSLANLEASRDVKDILMQCWAYLGDGRPDFTVLLKTLDKLPKKKLARSPSHPVHLSRSAESMF